MGSEIQAERANQSLELRDLQDTYRKKKQALEAAGQSELEKTRNENSDKIKTELQTGEAAINHVRVGNREQLSQLKAEADQRLVYERKNLGQRFQTQRDYNAEQMDGLNEALKTKQMSVEGILRQEEKKEAELHQREANATGEIQKQEGERRNKIYQGAQEEMTELQHRAQEQKQKFNETSHHEMAQLSEREQRDMRQLHARHQEDFDKQSHYSETQLKSQKEEQAKRIENDRAEFIRNDMKLRDHASRELSEEERQAEIQLGHVNRENQAAIERTRDRGTTSLEKTRAYYDKNIAEVHKRGETSLHSQQDMQHEKLKELKLEERDQLYQENQGFAEQLKDNEDIHKKQAEQNQTFYKQSLVEQKKKYDVAYNRNLKTFEHEVKDQKQRLAESLAHEKKEVIQDVGKYSAKSSDPFYRLTQPNAKLHETNDHYVVKARIPEHEKENFHVVVHSDRVIVQGERAYADQVDEENNKLSTHNYQTYRQELALEHPVREKFARTTYEDGVLTIRIPKA